MHDIAPILAAADAGLEASLDRLAKLMGFRSVSADPARAPDCAATARWLVEELSALGFEASVRETPGQPMVIAHWIPAKVTAKTPHLLFYGHYDVQPAEPLDKWDTDPFTLTRKIGSDGVERLYGRGSADDKGQLLTFIEAMRAWIRAEGSLPARVTIFLEGEEESGSPSLVPFLKANRDELACDVALVCDTNMWDARTPAITTRLRGLVHDEIIIRGPAMDLHSGSYGGPARNPVRVLMKIIADLHGADGKVLIPGFYEGVPKLSPATRAAWKGLKFSERKFLGDVGLSVPAGEKNCSVLEQVWARPTAEINGINGGYQGAGAKPVIPAMASAKITFRLVGEQKPEAILKAFRVFAKKRVPRDCSIEFSPVGGGSPAVQVSEKNAAVRKVAGALEEEFSRKAVLMGMGGSIPVVGAFGDVLGMDTILVGFGLGDDAIHSPNEKYNLTSFHKGIRSWVRILGALGNW